MVNTVMKGTERLAEVDIPNVSLNNHIFQPLGQAWKCSAMVTLESLHS